MSKSPLIIGIDLSNEYSQICYYNMRHERPESVTAGSAVSRYLIPAVLCYDDEKEKWLIGEEAALFSQQTGTWLAGGLYRKMMNGEKCTMGGRVYGYDEVIGIFLGRLLEMTRIYSGFTEIGNITLTLRSPGREEKEKFGDIFKSLGIDEEKIKVISYAESFAYYVLNEDESLWNDGALLFDFETDGFYVKHLMRRAGREEEKPLIWIEEKQYSSEFDVRDVASEIRRMEMDRRISQIFGECEFEGERASVYFTGTGFSELWFSETLAAVSEDFRVFKGNNLYVKGACLSGYERAFEGTGDYPIICKGRTRAAVSVSALRAGRAGEVTLSNPARDWYDAGFEGEFILTKDSKITFIVTSVISGERKEVVLDTSSFPERPDKTTRVKITLEYTHPLQCVVRVRDRGFGEFFPAEEVSVSKTIDLEGYI